MNPALTDIPERIMQLAQGALAQANHHAVFWDPGNEHWDFMCVLNTAHAGELFIKAVIAKEHPLLLFKELFSLDDNREGMIDLPRLIERGKTHDFDKLPQVLWAATGVRISNLECYDRVRRARNAIQHFCVPEQTDLRSLSLEFIYSVVDPLMNDQFKMHAIEFHEDHSDGYDYVVDAVVRRGLRFRVPRDFALTEISLLESITDTSDEYQAWMTDELRRLGKLELLTARA